MPLTLIVLVLCFRATHSLSRPLLQDASHVTKPAGCNALAGWPRSPRERAKRCHPFLDVPVLTLTTQYVVGTSKLSSTVALRFREAGVASSKAVRPRGLFAGHCVWCWVW